MGQVCTICSHPERTGIDRQIVIGVPNRRIAAQYDLSETAIRRHRAEHLPATLAKAQQAEEVARADDLLAQVRDLHRRALALLSGAEEAKDATVALRAIRECRANLELLAELAGEIDRRATITFAIVGSPEWIEIRRSLVAALSPYPAARAAVVAELAAVGIADDAA